MPSSLRRGRAFSCKIGAIFGRAALSIDVHTTARCAAPWLQRLALSPNAKVVPASEHPDPLQPSRRAMVLVSVGHQTEPVPHGETLSYPGLEVCETTTLARRSPETRAFPLLEGQAEDGDVVESQIMWFQG